MKRTIFSLFLLVAINVSAQLRRNINGIILGVSTKTEIINKIKAQHKIYTVQDNLLIVTQDNTFGGVNWFATFYRFYKNKVYKITYSKHANTSDTPVSLIDMQYSNLQKSYIRKYGNYTTRNFSSIYDTFTCFKDSATRITIEKGGFEGKYILSVSYTCLELEMQSYKDSVDEI